MKTRTFPGTLAAAAVSCLVLSWSPVSAISFSLDILSPTPAPPDDILAPGPVPVLFGGGSGFDVNGISYGHPHTAFASVAGLAFSVDRFAGGAPGTATFTESGGGATFGEQSADVYSAMFAAAGFNTLLHDGDGASPPGAGIPPIGLGLIEAVGGSPTDDLNALDLRLPAFGGPVYWTADALTLPGGSADIFLTTSLPYTAFPATYASSATLGLAMTDDIDGLVVFDDGDGIYGAADTILFSLAPGSPSLPGLFAGPGDVFFASGGGPVSGVYAPAGVLGLAPGDNVNALDIHLIPEPSSPLLLGIGFTCLMLCHRRWTFT